MATYINNNVKFHAFSKSPVSPDTTLGGAVNPSGHTITTSQVRAQDIPAFLNTFQGTKDQALTWLATNYATPAHNDIVYYGGEFKAGFSTPKCLKYNAKAETPAWEDFDITTATTLKNADDTDVIAVHQNCTTVFVDGGNNAATNSNRWSLFVKKSDGSILDHFVASTDKIVAGMPSLGYNALVLWNGAAIDEGELDANYVGNTFAGIVHLNKQYATGDDAKFKVTCFEYIGDKLDTSISGIRQSIKDISDVTLKGVVASVTADENTAQKAGITVDNTVSTTPVIKFTAGSVTSGETKLVTGGAVATVTDALAGRIAALEGVKLSVQVVDTLPTTPVVNTLYLVPEQGSTTGTYVEYIAYKPEGSETVTTERIGTTAVDLEGYTTDAEHKALADRVEALDKADGKIATIEGQIATITSTDATKEGSIAKALADAKSYVDTTALTPETGSIAKYVENYVATNAKVSVNGQSATTITVAGTSDGSADLVKVVVTEDKTTTDKIGLTLTATADVATVTDGAITSGHEGKLVKAGDAKAIAEKAINTAITETDGVISDAISDAISGATLTSADNAIENATGDAETKLVTAEQVKEYVDENAKVTLTADTADGKTGIVIDNNGQEATSFTIGIDQTVIATKKSVDDLSGLVSGLPATIQAAQDAADDAMEEAQAKVASVTLGTVPTGVSLGDDLKNPVLTIETAATATHVSNGQDAAKLVTGGVVKDVVMYYTETASSTIDGRSLTNTTSSTQGSYVSVTTTGTVGTGLTINVDDSALASTVSAAASAVQSVKVNGAELTKDGNKAVDITAIVGVVETTTNGVNVTKTSDNKVQVTVTDGQYVSSTKSWTHPSYLAKASDVATAISDAVSAAVGAIVIPGVDASVVAKNVGFDVGTHPDSKNHYIDLATAVYTPAVGETAAAWTNKGYLVTGSTVETFVAAETAKALSEAKAYSESLHTTSVDYVVADTLPTVEAGKEEDFKGKIYLVVTGKDGVVAADGSRIEYMYVQENGVWGWEQIGTTTADLSGYAKSVKINGATAVTPDATTGVIDLGTVASGINTGNVVTSSSDLTNVDSVQALLSDKGCLYLGVASATDSVMGVSKMFTGNLSTDASTVVDTAVSVKSAQAMYSSLATLADSKIAGLGDYANLAGLAASGNTISPVVVHGNLFEYAVSVENGIATAENSAQYPVDAHKIVDGTEFAKDITTLTTWIDDLPNMTEGTSMFQGCTSLTTFIGDLSAMTDGSSMFQGCTSLTTFIGDLSSLTNGSNMFVDCKLDDESVECIFDTIPVSNGAYMSLGCNAEGFAKAIEITGAEVADDATSFASNFKDWKLTFIKNV